MGGCGGKVIYADGSANRRNVALKRANPRKGRFKEEIGRRRGPGRKGGGGRGGRFTKPSPLQVVNARRWVGEPSP